MPPEHSPDFSSLDSATAVFLGSRSRLFGVAYRMLGTVAEAEDVVQETWLRWQTTDRSAVLEPVAYLVSVATRIAINIAQSAHSRRETYIGPWLPEPVDTSADPTLGAERGEALELAVLLLMEKLRPTERAAYVLREAFEYSHRQIAAVLDVTESNVRQIVTRARKHIAGERRAPATKAEQERLLRAFLTAAQQGELSALEQLLGSDAVQPPTAAEQCEPRWYPSAAVKRWQSSLPRLPRIGGRARPSRGSRRTGESPRSSPGTAGLMDLYPAMRRLRRSNRSCG
jgi:RNA polymerase sigma-70 factor, ECF subfamily